MSDVGIMRGPLPEPWRTAREVTVTIPAAVANDLDRMHGVVKGVLGQLGCPTCHSGFDLRFRQSLDFVVSAEGDVAQGIAQIVG
jgi:hypothetical protein